MIYVSLHSSSDSSFSCNSCKSVSDAVVKIAIHSTDFPALLVIMNDVFFKWLKFGDIFAKFNPLRVHFSREIAKINTREIWLYHFREIKYTRKLVRIR